jgi:hypothetical protein
MATTLILVSMDYLFGSDTDRYEEGRNCERIEQDTSGRWWVSRTSHERVCIPDHRIAGVLQKRPTVADPVKSALPEYVEPNGAQFKCKKCLRSFGSLQGVKTHHGIEHGEVSR